jgi:hypothetical protein
MAATRCSPTSISPTKRQSGGLKATSTADRREFLNQGRRHQDTRGPPEGGRRGAQGAACRVSDRAHPSGDRPQGAYTRGPTPRTSRAGRRRRLLPPLELLWEHQTRPDHLPLPLGGGSLAWDNAAPCTIRSTTTTATAVSCTASPWRARAALARSPAAILGTTRAAGEIAVPSGSPSAVSAVLDPWHQPGSSPKLQDLGRGRRNEGRRPTQRPAPD